MGTLISSVKRKVIVSIRKARIIGNIMVARSGVGIMITPKQKKRSGLTGHYLTYEFFKDLSLVEAMTMVVELKRKISFLEAHIDAAAHIKGERETLEALKKTMDVTVGVTPDVIQKTKGRAQS